MLFRSLDISKTKTTNINYTLANELDGHGKLLEIQSELYKFKNQYKQYKGIKNSYFTSERITALITFIDTSLNTLCNVICHPIILICDDIKEKIQKYKVQPTRNSKLANYDILDKIIGANCGLNIGSHMELVELKGSNS